MLNGGGITAAAFEIGCLAALDRTFGDGFCGRAFGVYVGVSAGSIVATMVASGILPGHLRSAILNDRDVPYNFRRRDIYRVDARPVAGYAWQIVQGVVSLVREARRRNWSLSAADVIYVVQERLPPGLFSLAPLQGYIASLLRGEGRADDFSAIDHDLLVPAIDLDRGERVAFGAPGFRAVRISEAVAASCAIPGFFRPFRIDGRHYIDGGVKGMCHLDLALERGARRILIVNALVPVVCDPERVVLPRLSRGSAHSVADLGIGFVGDQSLRIQGRERLDAAIAATRARDPGVQIELIEPAADETLLFLNGPMAFDARRRILELGYELTLARLERDGGRIAQLLGAPQRCVVGS